LFGFAAVYVFKSPGSGSEELTVGSGLLATGFSATPSGEYKTDLAGDRFAAGASGIEANKGQAKAEILFTRSRQRWLRC